MVLTPGLEKVIEHEPVPELMAAVHDPESPDVTVTVTEPPETGDDSGEATRSATAVPMGAESGVKIGKPTPVVWRKTLSRATPSSSYGTECV